jgi:hypothetical protein
MARKRTLAGLGLDEDTDATYQPEPVSEADVQASMPAFSDPPKRPYAKIQLPDIFEGGADASTDYKVLGHGRVKGIPPTFGIRDDGVILDPLGDPAEVVMPPRGRIISDIANMMQPGGPAAGAAKAISGAAHGGVTLGVGPTRKAAARTAKTGETIADLGMGPPPPEPGQRLGHNGGPVLADDIPAARRGMAAVPDLRTLGQDEAIAAAANQPHLIPKPDGGFVGGPRDVKNKRQLKRVRDQFDERLDRGAEGGDWYERGRGFVEEAAGPDPARQRLLARESGEFSAGVSPESELMFTLREHNGYELGEPRTAHYPAQHERYMDARESGDLSKIATGDKTGIYAQNLDPTRPFSAVGTNDFRNAQNFKYTDPQGRPLTQALGDAEHKFLDYETVLAAKRANERASAGRTNWSGPQTQAAPWVVQKAEALMEQRPGITWEEAFAEANKTQADFLDKHTFNSTYELTPGVMTDHRPDISGGSQAAKEAFANDPRRSWQTPEGRDVMLDAIGLYQRPTQRSTGLYTPPGGKPEVNPAFVARPLVDMQAGGKGVHPVDLAGLGKVEGTRAYFDAQGAGAGSKAILNAKPGDSGSLFLKSPNGPLTVDQLAKLKDVGAKHGLGDVVDYGPGGTAMTNFAGAPSGNDTGKALRKGSLLSDLGGAAPGAEVKRAKVEGIYAGYEDLWPKGVGSGEATRELFNLLDSPQAPSVLQKLDADPKVRAAVLGRFEADAEAAKAGAKVRPDLQNARKIFAEGGFTGLRAALNAGKVALPSVLIPFLIALQQLEPARGE